MVSMNQGLKLGIVLLCFGAFLLIAGLLWSFNPPQGYIDNMPAKIAEPNPFRVVGIIAAIFGILILGFGLLRIKRA